MLTGLGFKGSEAPVQSLGEQLGRGVKARLRDHVAAQAVGVRLDHGQSHAGLEPFEVRFALEDDVVESAHSVSIPGERADLVREARPLHVGIGAQDD